MLIIEDMVIELRKQEDDHAFPYFLVLLSDGDEVASHLGHPGSGRRRFRAPREGYDVGHLWKQILRPPVRVVGGIKD